VRTASSIDCPAVGASAPAPRRLLRCRLSGSR
jgi:hypothetical protein